LSLDIHVHITNTNNSSYLREYLRLYIISEHEFCISTHAHKNIFISQDQLTIK